MLTIDEKLDKIIEQNDKIIAFLVQLNRVLEANLTGGPIPAPEDEENEELRELNELTDGLTDEQLEDLLLAGYTTDVLKQLKD